MHGQGNGFVSVTNASIGHSDVPSVEDDERISYKHVRERQNTRKISDGTELTRWAQIQAVLDSWSMERDQH